MSTPARFTVTFTAPAGAEGLRAVRALLKIAGRRFGLRCVAVAQTADDADPERLADARSRRTAGGPPR